jgi:hypothetical protein
VFTVARGQRAEGRRQRSGVFRHSFSLLNPEEHGVYPISIDSRGVGATLRQMAERGLARAAQQNQNKMKMKTSIKLALLGSMALGVAAWTLVAQDSRDQSQNGDRPPRQDRPPMGRDGQRPLPPLLAALDANHDGVIDADEIKNASAALLKLDKNGDGKLTPEEFMGRPPGRPDGAPGAGRSDGPPAGGPSDRPEVRRDARFDDGGRPPYAPGNEAGDFRPPRDGRGPGGPGGPAGREFADRAPGARGGPPSADSILQRFDTDKDGQLNKTELAAFLKDMQSHRPPPLAGGPRPGPGGPGGPPPEDGPPR